MVENAHRSAGYAGELLAAVEDWARDRHCEYVALALRSGNDDARWLYEAGLSEWGL